MTRKYSFGRNDKAAVDCPAMDAFLADLLAVFQKHRIGYEIESYDSGGGYLVPTSIDYFDIDDFRRHLDKYHSGVSWLDEAKQRYEELLKEVRNEASRKEAVDREQRERETYERLRLKYGATIDH